MELLYRILKFVQSLFNYSYRLFQHNNRLLIILNSYFEALCLGLLSKNQHEKIIKISYNQLQKYSVTNFNLSGFKNWEQFILDKYVPSSSTITIIAAGGGREALALAKDGHKIMAYEQDLKMMKFARSFFKNQNTDIIFNHLPINTIPINKCDIFWFGWGVYSHIIDRKSRVSQLTEASKTLNTNGKIIISFWAESRTEARTLLIKNIANKVSKRKIERGESFISTSWAKYYTKAEILEEAFFSNLNVDYISNKEYGHAVLSIKKTALR